MNDVPASRSALLALLAERRAMREGYAFLDEKCVLLAGAILRELRDVENARKQCEGLRLSAAQSLAAAVSCLGLEALQCYPPMPREAIGFALQRSALLGVPLLTLRLEWRAPPAEPALGACAEAEACRAAFAALAERLGAMAASAANLERLCEQYRRAMRRARALENVVLPELERSVTSVEARLEELEQDEGTWLRHSRPAG